MTYLRHGAEVPTKGKGSKLSDKMKAFIDEYMVDLNASRAVKAVGYKTGNPNKLAFELLQHPLIRAEIDKRMEEKREKNELTAQYVLVKLQKIIEATEEDNPNAALRGLELIGKHLGMYKERTEISGPDGKAIEMEQRTKERVSDFTSKIARLAAREGTDGVVEFPKRQGEGGA